MKLGIMQPYFMPYIGYWQRIHAVDQHVIFDDVNYIKRGWMNRNRIMIAGEPHFLNMNLFGASQNKLINEVEVNPDIALQSKMLKTLELAYKKATHYDEAMKCLEPIIRNTETNLAKYLEFQIRELCTYMGISTEIVMSSSIEKNNLLKGQEKIIEICHKQGASTYYNAHTGMELYSEDVFEKEGLKLVFIKDAATVQYHQLSSEFIPAMSIIDVLMNCSKSEITTLLDDYVLLK